MPRAVKFGVLPALFVIAALAAVYGASLGTGGSGSEAAAIEALIPGPEETTLRQGRVGIELEAGWNAELVLNGTPIPDEQHTRNLELGQITFLPRPGRAVEHLRPGENCVQATYWEIARDRAETESVRTWCFTAT